jgi:hypothetical protein
MEEKDIIMEDKELNEQESLKLITQMIQNTRRNLDTGSGNMFLLWGYVSAIVTLVVLQEFIGREILFGCGAFGEFRF